jgi:2-keto-4-pentenoate hydratase
MTPEMNDEAASILLSNWNAVTRIDALPESCRPRDRADGYAIAAALAEQSGDIVAGWKIAATSEAGQKHINVDGPLAGRILARRVLQPGASIPFAGNLMKVAEAEFAFVVGKAMPDQGAPYTREEVMDAVSAMHLSIEVPDSRYVDFTKVGAPSLIADSACASWLVVGPKVDAPWHDIDLSSHQVAAFKNGSQAAVGTGKAVLGDPRIALTWLVNEAARYGGGVQAGQFVTTGTCVIPVPVTSGDEISVDYGVLGTIAAAIG